MPGATIRVRPTGGVTFGRLTAAEGVLLTLTDPAASAVHRERAVRTAATILADPAFSSLVEGAVSPGAYRPVARALAERIERDRHTLHEVSADAAAPPVKNSAFPGDKAPKAPAVKARGGGKPTAPKAPKAPGATGAFEEQHPRGRGGLWIKKGDGMGSQGPQPQVAQLQKRLQQLGYGPGATDGKFGPVTEQALMKFQNAYGLPQTGQMNPSTLATLQTPPPQTVPQIQAQNLATSQLPNATGQVPHHGTAARGGTGTGVGAAGGTGIPGAPSVPGSTAGAASSGGGSSAPRATLDTHNQQAVSQFQQAHGLKVDGQVGPQTQGAMAALGIGAGTTQPTHNADGTVSAPTHNADGTLAAPGVTTGTLSRTGTGTRSRSTKVTPGISGKGKNTVIGLGAGVSGQPLPAVQAIQTALQALGYDLGSMGVDGRFGADTRKAVQKLQRRYGLKADGKVGSATGNLIKRLAKSKAQGVRGKNTVTSGDQIVASALQTWEDTAAALQEAERASDVEAVLEARTAHVMATYALEEFSLRHPFDASRHPKDRKGRWQMVGVHSTDLHMQSTTNVARLHNSLIDAVSGKASPGESGSKTLAPMLLKALKNTPDRHLRTYSERDLGNLAQGLEHVKPLPGASEQQARVLAIRHEGEPVGIRAAQALGREERKLRESALGTDFLRSAGADPRYDTQVARVTNGAAYAERQKWKKEHPDLAARQAQMIKSGISPDKVKAWAINQLKSTGADAAKYGKGGAGHADSAVFRPKTRAGDPSHPHDRLGQFAFKGSRQAQQAVNNTDGGSMRNLSERLEEATYARETAASTAEFIRARALEQEIARQMLESVTGKLREDTAVIKRRTPGGGIEHKFPIPNKSHARAALAYLDRSDLNEQEKSRVKAAAKAKLAEADTELDEILWTVPSKGVHPFDPGKHPKDRLGRWRDVSVGFGNRGRPLPGHVPPPGRDYAHGAGD